MQVLFVCHANMCRSALAEALGRKLASERSLAEPVAFRSAGIAARQGLGAATEAIAVAAEYGVDLSTHQTTPLSVTVGDWADYLVTMTRAQKADVLIRLPMLRERTCTLAEYVRETTGCWPSFRDVKDPVGGTIQDFRKCGQLLYQSLTDVLDALSGSEPQRRGWLHRVLRGRVTDV